MSKHITIDDIKWTSGSVGDTLIRQEDGTWAAGAAEPASSDTGATIKSKLEALTNDARLDASAIKNLPQPIQAETSQTIKGKLELLTNNDRLDASAIKNLPIYSPPSVPPRAELIGTEINHANSTVLFKTMTANSAFTIINPKFNEVITLELQGNYTRTWPASMKKLAGEYDVTKVNVYHIHCVNAALGSEKYHYTIS